MNDEAVIEFLHQAMEYAINQSLHDDRDFPLLDSAQSFVEAGEKGNGLALNFADGSEYRLQLTRTERSQQ